jgi:hypothetical protein
MSRSLIRQFEQIRGTYTFFDAMYRQYAEMAGRHYLSATISTTSGSAVVSDGSNSFTSKDVGNYVVIDSGDAAGVYEITSVSGVDGVVSPVLSATGSFSYRRHYYKNTEDDLNYIRKMLALILGEGAWNASPATDLSTVASTLASGISANAFKYMTDGTHIATASGNDTFTFEGGGTTTVVVNTDLKKVTIESTAQQNIYDVDFSWQSSTLWEAPGTFTVIPSGLSIYTNGLLNKPNDSNYYTTAISGSKLQVSFGYDVSSTDWWVHGKYYA